MKKENKNSKKENIDQIMKLKLINKLKSVYRLNSVDKRHESSAEHSWSCLILADYFLNKTKTKIDKLKVYELLMYHDLVEIYAGDTPHLPGKIREEKHEKEMLAAEKLRKELPEPTANKFYSLFLEFEEEKTIEAKFAKIIDYMDAQIHEIDYKKDWKGWTKKFLIERRLHKFDDFPEIKKDFLDFLDLMEEEGYFSQ